MKKSSPRNALYIYGFHAVTAAMHSEGRKIFEILITQNSATRLEAKLKQKFSGIIKTLKPDEISKILPEGAVHQGIAALVEPLPEIGVDDFLDSIKDDKSALVVALDQVTDPQNVGAVIRSCAAFGVRGLVLTERNAPEQTASLVKCSAGTIEFVPIVRVVNLANTMEKFKQAGFFCLGLAGEARTLLSGYKFPDKTLFIMGSEGEGLRRLTRENCDELLKIKTSDKVESLNISAAAAISLYEAGKRG